MAVEVIDKQLEYNRTYAQKLRDEGICIKCHKPNDRPNKRYCTQCLAYFREWRRNDYQRLIAAHRCRDCRTVMPKDYKLKTCPKCIEYTNFQAKQRRIAEMEKQVQKIIAKWSDKE